MRTRGEERVVLKLISYELPLTKYGCVVAFLESVLFIGTVCVYYCSTLLLFISAVPNTILCAWGEEDSGGHVL